MGDTAAAGVEPRLVLDSYSHALTMYSRCAHTVFTMYSLPTFYVQAVRAFEPEAIFLSTGFDAHAQEEVQGG